jgi:hypothetical protein
VPYQATRDCIHNWTTRNNLFHFMVFDVCVSLLRDTSAKRIPRQTHTPLRRLRTLQHMLRLFESRHSFLQCRWFEVLDNYDSFVLFIQSYSYMCINIYIYRYRYRYIYICVFDVFMIVSNSYIYIMYIMCTCIYRYNA